MQRDRLYLLTIIDAQAASVRILGSTSREDVERVLNVDGIDGAPS